MLLSKLRPAAMASVALAAVTALSACSVSTLFNATLSSSGYERVRDIAFGDDPRLKLDVYKPKTPSPRREVIVFFYGGSWQSGSKDTYPFIARSLTAMGYTVVIPDYRLYPAVKFPEFLEDNARAVAWVMRNIESYQGSPRHVFLAGHSAGAYNAVMLAIHPQFLKAQGVDRMAIAGVIGLAGPYDFLPFTDEDIIAVFSSASDRETQPITYAATPSPPMLLLTGTDDTTVLAKNTHNLAQKLEASGNDVRVLTYPGVAHYGIVLALSEWFRGKAPVLSDVGSFIAAHEAGQNKAANQ